MRPARQATTSQINWPQVLGLVAVQGSVTLAWVIYALYLPDLLTTLGFSKGLAGLLLLIEHLLEAGIEPVFGHLSDLSHRKMGSRFPWIYLGVSLAALLFGLLPLVPVLFSPHQLARWSLPVLAVLWASAMAIFRSPVMVLLGQATPAAQLPIAASGLTFIQHLIGAFRFTAYAAILALGPVFTFVLGSGVLATAAFILGRVTPRRPPQPRSPQAVPWLSPAVAIALGGTGISLGLALRFLFSSLSKLFGFHWGAAAVSLSLLGFSLIVAFSALPAGQLASRIGNAKATMMGLGGTALCLGLASVASAKLFFAVVAIALGITFSLALNGMIPFVLETAPRHRSGLGMGLYFGGFSGALGFFDVAFASMVSVSATTTGGIFFLGLASVFVFWGHSRQGR